MSSYPFPAAAPPQAAMSSADPTAVMGRRIGAWVVDFLLYALIMSFVGPTPLSPLAEYVDTSDFPGVDCSVVQDANDVSGCLEIGDRLYFTEGSDAAIGFVVFLAVFLLYSFMQGATGRTPGKAALGIKVVDEQGGTPGFGKSILRTVLWIVDGAPWCIPLVGFITGLTTKGHRRVGDMAAKTFVVGKGHTGPPQVPGLVTAAAGGWSGGPGTGPYAQPGQPWGAAPQGAPGQPTAWGGQRQAQPSGAWGTPPAGGPPIAGGPPGAGGRPPVGGPPPSPAAPSGPAGTPSDENRPAAPGSWAAPGAGTPSPAADSPTSPSADTPSGAPASPSTDTPSGAPASPSADTPSGAPASPSADTPSGASSSTTDTSSGDASASDDTRVESPTETTSGAAGTPASTDATKPFSTPQPAVGHAPAGQPATAQPAAGQPAAAAPSGYSPQWDAARGTYIVWEPNRGKWLGWDEAGQEWKPL